MNRMKSNLLPIPVEIKNLGAVDNAIINFKPLTVFVGENNTGKTYSAYLIGYTFSTHSLFDFLNEYHTKKTKVKFLEIDSFVEKIFAEKKGEFKLDEFIEKNSKKYFNCICKEIVPKKYKKFLASESRSFNNTKLKMDLESAIDGQLQNFRKYSNYYNDFLNHAWKEDSVHLSITKGVLKFYIDNNSEIDRNKLKRIVFLSIFSILHRSIFNEVYFFGAERTGLTLFVHSKSTIEDQTDDEEYSKKELDPKKPKKEEFRVFLAPHVEESLGSFVKCYDHDAHQERDEKFKKYPGLKKFLTFADILESKILGGKIEIKEQKRKQIKKIVFQYQKNKEIELDMPISSSAVKGLSPLVLDLKYYVEPDELIIIDEPEMNLHPKAQAELIELIALIVNAGVHIIITTHSPYIIDHLSNLIKANENKDRDKIKNKFFLKRKDAFISQKDVSIYLFEKNSAKSILNSKGDINWNTFSKVAEKIYKIHREI